MWTKMTNISVWAINNHVLDRSSLKFLVKFVGSRQEFCQFRLNRF